MPTQEAVIATQEANQPQEEAKRERSTIQFPYLPLDDAVAIAKGVHAVSGGTCQVDQLAAHLNQSAASSMFKLRLSTARIFNLVTYSQGTVTLTPLGVRMCDPQREQAARADAFLAVPLYSRVHEQFKGVNLPPPSGLETAMVNMGVAPKQKDSARQVFQRSATQAGFFAYGPNRLVYPPTRSSAGAAASEVNPAPGEVENVQEKPTKKKRQRWRQFTASAHRGLDKDPEEPTA